MTYHHLTIDERSQIYALVSIGHKQTEIASHLKVHPSTISRELKRNAGLKGYRIKQAQEKASTRRAQASSTPKRMTKEMIEIIESKLCEEWSPEQIAGVLKAQKKLISHECIYQHVWANKKAGGSLYKHLRHRGKKYNHRSSGKAGRGVIPNRIDINQRPAIVDKKIRLGDWEADTIIGAQHKGAILSLVDRKSKFTLLVNLASKTAEEVLRGIKIAFNKIPRKIIKTITFDNGKEFSWHEKIADILKAKCYFATPYHSWERGLNEHTNGLVRQYYPKGTDFSNLNDEETQWIEDKLNNRPRKVLNFRTPREVLMGIKRPQKIALHG